MQIVRTIVWVALLVVFVAFTMLNWDKALTVRIWPGIVWDTRLPAVVVVSFLLGLLPMWLIHRGSKWRLQRRIASLETAARNAAIAPAPSGPAPVATASAAAPVEGVIDPTPADPPLAATDHRDPPLTGTPVPKDEILR
ncbi:MAG: LapA family protein [Cypionkella sp.]